MINLNFSTMHITAPFTNSPLSTSTDIGEDNIDTNKQYSVAQSTQVSISTQAQEKLAQEKSGLSQELEQQNNSAEAVDRSKSDSETKSLDRLIEETQEKIKEIQEKLRSLKADKSEEAQQEQKMLVSQVMSLNAVLISLFGKKLEALEQ